MCDLGYCTKDIVFSKPSLYDSHLQEFALCYCKEKGKRYYLYLYAYLLIFPEHVKYQIKFIVI